MLGTPEGKLHGMAPISITENHPEQGAQLNVLSGQESLVSLQGSPNRLKADINTANGGVGVSYSNVVLSGGIDPREGSGGTLASSYKSNYANGANQV